MKRWIRRESTPEDEPGLVYLWLKSYAHSKRGRALGAHIDRSEAEIAFWGAERGEVLYLLKHARVEVVCDPDAPEVFWAFACTSGDTVHYALVKRRFDAHAGEILPELLGDRLGRACPYTRELSEFRRLDMPVPKLWFRDDTWMGRQLLPPARAA